MGQLFGRKQIGLFTDQPSAQHLFFQAEPVKRMRPQAQTVWYRLNRRKQAFSHQFTRDQPFPVCKVKTDMLDKTRYVGNHQNDFLVQSSHEGENPIVARNRETDVAAAKGRKTIAQRQHFA